MRIAGIGSRDLSAEQLQICTTLGELLAQNGHHLYSGNAEGADYAFASGANVLDPSHVHLMLPWRTYNQSQTCYSNQLLSVEDLTKEELSFYSQEARKYHPRYDALTQGAKKLHLRNGMILLPPVRNQPTPVDLCLAWPSNKPSGGGTGQGMRLAAAHGIRLVDLSRCTREDLFNLCDEL